METYEVVVLVLVLVFIALYSFKTEIKRKRKRYRSKSNYMTSDEDRSEKSFSYYVQEISKEMKLDEQQDENGVIVENMINWLIYKMKESSNLFKRIYEELYFTGSYYENLRVKNATEFDINILLYFPKCFKLKIIPKSFPIGFAEYCLSRNKLNKLPLTKDEYDEMSGLFDTGYLLPERVKSWIYKLIDRIIQRNLYNANGIKKITLCRNDGPAIRLKIHYGRIALDIDLVPAIKCISPYWPRGAECSFLDNVPNRQWNCLMIPKPPSEDSCEPYLRKHLWRFHFPEIEKLILTRFDSCIKTVIKMMKLLRDKQGWTCLVSYHLKTVVMLEIVIHRDLNCNQDQKGPMFIMMLEKLDEYICSKFLPHVMYPENNLFHGIDDREFNNIHRKLWKIIGHISNDHSALKKYLSDFE